jgi:cysteine-S-conjugate beta-lyase
MVFDFDAQLNRRKTESVKWHAYDEDVIPMWVADMDFRSPDCVIQALKERVDHGVFGYPAEMPVMRETVQTWVKDRYGWAIEPESIVFLPGVVTGFNLASHALAGNGKSVVYHTPAYPPFLHVAQNSDSSQVQVELVRGPDGSYEIDFDLFEAAISKQKGMFLLCNPQNPTGRVFRRDELEKMADICLRHGVMICSDEIHADFVYTGHKHIPIASLSPQVAQHTITLIAPSKTFNIAGLESAVAVVTNPDLRTKLMNSTRGLMAGTNLLGQVATVAAYSQGGPWLDALLKYLESNRDFLVEYVKTEFPGVEMGKPEGTFLGWLDCNKLNFEESPCQYFIEKARVAMNDGERFGNCGRHFVRINFGCPRAQLVEALGRVKKSLIEKRE